MSVSNKKLLANQIKEDLQKDLEEAKKEEKSKNGFGGCSWLITLGEDCASYRGNEWRLCYFGSDKDKYKEKQHPGAREGIYVFPEELEPNDWKEIESLIQQIEEIEKKKEEKETQKYQEEQAKIDQKLNSNLQMFLYEGGMEWAVDYDPRGYDKFRVFRGMENGQKFHLAFPENHPLVANFTLNQDRNKDIFQIEGVENIPFQPEGKNNKQLPWKKVNLSDKITIAKFKESADNLESPEKKQVENKPTDNSNSRSKELSDKDIIFQYFQQKNIKSIRLENDKLIIKYNNSTTESKEASNNELQRTKSYLQKIGKSELFLSDLERNNNQSPKSNKVFYIGLAIVGILIVGIISWLLTKNKKDKQNA